MTNILVPIEDDILQDAVKAFNVRGEDMNSMLRTYVRSCLTQVIRSQKLTQKRGGLGSLKGEVWMAEDNE